MCCDFCSGAYHLACIRPEMTEEPPEDTQWFCQFCSVEDASATSFTPLGEAHAGARYWFVGGHIFAEDCATGQFAPCTKGEVAELLSGFKTVRAAKRLHTALESRYQHLSEAPIPTELCKALNGLSDEPVPVGGTPLPELRNVSCRYLRPRAPLNHSVHWDFSPESGGAWFWCDTANDFKSQWTNPDLQTGTHTHTHTAEPVVYGVKFAPDVYTKGYTKNATKFSKIHYEFPAHSQRADTERDGESESASLSESTVETLGKSITYVHSSTWSPWEDLHLLLLIRRDGVGDWGVKAAQLGGKRSAGAIHRHYAKLESAARLAHLPQTESLLLIKDRSPQRSFGETDARHSTSITLAYETAPVGSRVGDPRGLPGERLLGRRSPFVGGCCPRGAKRPRPGETLGTAGGRDAPGDVCGGMEDCAWSRAQRPCPAGEGPGGRGPAAQDHAKDSQGA